MREGDLAQAQQMAAQHLEGKYSVSYLPLCDVHIRHHLPDGEPREQAACKQRRTVEDHRCPFRTASPYSS